MKKFLKKNLGSTCLVIVLVLAVMGVGYHIQDVKRYNARLAKQEKNNLNGELKSSLHIQEHIIQVTADRVELWYRQCYENKLIQDLSYYNHKNADGVTLTVEDAMTEYDNFCNNTGDYSRILAYNEFWQDEINQSYIRGFRSLLSDFYRRDYTGEKKAFDDTIYTGGFNELTSEEMWELCDAYFAQNGE